MRPSSCATPFAVAAPVVFYGTSITQGGCASRPGMSYQAILGRRLNLNHVNLGFSGNGKGEAAVARAVAEIDAAAFVLDFAQNNTDVDSLAQVYDPFIGILRERHPDTPIVAITPIYAAGEATGSQRNEQMRALIRKVVSRRIARRRHPSATGGRHRPARSFPRGRPGGWHASQRPRLSMDGGRSRRTAAESARAVETTVAVR